jgi:aminoacrylate hydrolase
MPTARVGGADIHYEIHGSGPPLLLVAGLGGVGAYWEPQIASFARRFTVVVHDHRGCGRSTRSEIAYSVDQMTRDLVGLMDALAIESAHVLGHSTGGAIGQTLAIEQPERVRSLVLYATWTRADAFFRRVMEARKTLVERAGPEAYVRATPVFLYPDWWLNENPDALAALDRRTIESFPPVAIVASRCQAVIEFDKVDQLDCIRAQTLVVCARDDFLTPPYFSEELAQRIPSARLRTH